MISIDAIAQVSRYKKLHPAEKICFCLMSILTILVIRNYIILFTLILLLLSFLLLIAKVPVKMMKMLLGIPLPFIVISCMTLMISIDFDHGFYVSFVPSEWNLALLVFLRNITSLLCLHCLILTTPLHHFISGLSILRCPDLLIELMLMMYKYVFIFFDISRQIFCSQQARSGYSSYRQSFHSLSLLITSLFTKAMRKGHLQFTALQARGYNGRLHGIHQHGAVSYIRLIGFPLLCLLIILLCRK